jgi:hypothetical protein
LRGRKLVWRGVGGIHNRRHIICAQYRTLPEREREKGGRRAAACASPRRREKVINRAYTRPPPVRSRIADAKSPASVMKVPFGAADTPATEPPPDGLLRAPNIIYRRPGSCRKRRLPNVRSCAARPCASRPRRPPRPRAMALAPGDVGVAIFRESLLSRSGPPGFFGGSGEERETWRASCTVASRVYPVSRVIARPYRSQL